jgi:hypothetical protein
VALARIALGLFFCPWSAEDAGLVRRSRVFGNPQRVCQVWNPSVVALFAIFE